MARKNVVTYDREAKKLVFNLLPNMDKHNQTFASMFAKELVGMGPGGAKSQAAAIAQNFQRIQERQNDSGTEKGRIYTPLSQKYYDKKEKRGKRNYFVNKGTLKTKTRTSVRGKIVGGKIVIKSTVPNYGNFVNDGTKKMPERKFYTVRDTQRTKAFFDRIDKIWKEVINKLGIKVK